MHRAHKHVLGLVVASVLGSTSVGGFAPGESTSESTAFGFPPELVALAVIGGLLGLFFLLVALAGAYGVANVYLGEGSFDELEAKINPVPFVIFCLMVGLVGWFVLNALGDMTLMGNLDVPFVDRVGG